MRAIRFEKDGSVEAVDLPKPTLGDGDVLVQVLAAGVCRTDLHILDAVREGRHGPVVPGHEIAGRVVAKGKDVYLANVGDYVGVHYEQPCGTCRACRRKRTNLCKVGTSLGFSAPGGYAEFVKSIQASLLPLPPGMDPALAAPLSCSGSTAYRVVVTLGQADEGDVVVIAGAGGVGLSAVQIARARQARVLVVDPREEARRAATELGAERAVAPADAAEAVWEMSGDDRADIVADFVGSAESLERSRSLLGFGGRLVAVAEGKGTDQTIPVSAADLVEGGKAYLGAYSSTMAEFARVLQLAEAGRLTPHVTRRARLEEAPEVLQDLAAGRIVGRAVLLPEAR